MFIDKTRQVKQTGCGSRNCAWIRPGDACARDGCRYDVGDLKPVIRNAFCWQWEGGVGRVERVRL